MRFRLKVLFCGLMLVEMTRPAAAQENTPPKDEASQLQSAQQYAAAHPGDPDARYRLAYALFLAQRPVASLQAYTAAAHLRTPSADDLLHVGWDYALLSSWENAAHWFTVATTLDPANVQAWYHLGRVQVQLNHFDKAEAAFRHVLTLDPRHPRALSNLGIVYDGLNEHAQALVYYRQGIDGARKQQPPDAQPLIDYATSLIDNNAADEARSLLLEARPWAPDDLRLHQQLARAELRLADLHSAQSELEWIVARDPDDAADHFQLGRVYKQLGDTQKAAAEFKTSQKLMTKTPSAQPAGPTGSRPQ